MCLFDLILYFYSIVWCFCLKFNVLGDKENHK